MPGWTPFVYVTHKVMETNRDEELRMEKLKLERLKRAKAPFHSLNWVRQRIAYIEAGKPLGPKTNLVARVVTPAKRIVSENHPNRVIEELTSELNTLVLASENLEPLPVGNDQVIVCADRHKASRYTLKSLSIPKGGRIVTSSHTEGSTQKYEHPSGSNRVFDPGGSKPA